MPLLVKITDYSRLLLFHVGMNDITNWSLGKLKDRHKALGVQAWSTGAQVMFSFILLVREKDAARNRCIMQISYRLCGWCLHEGFGFYDNGRFFGDYSLLERDGIHLSRRDKGIFGSRQASFVR